MEAMGGWYKSLKYVISNKTHNINNGVKVIYRKVVNNDRSRFFIKSVCTGLIKAIQKGLEKQRESGTSQGSRVRGSGLIKNTTRVVFFIYVTNCSCG